MKVSLPVPQFCLRLCCLFPPSRTWPSEQAAPKTANTSRSFKGNLRPHPRPPRHRQQGERAGPRDLLLGPRPLSDHIHLAEGSHRSRRPDAPPSPSPSERLSSSSWDKTSRDKACVFILPLNSLAEDKLRQPSLLLSATSSYEAACARGISSNLTVEAKVCVIKTCFLLNVTRTESEERNKISPLIMFTTICKLSYDCLHFFNNRGWWRHH